LFILNHETREPVAQDKEYTFEDYNNKRCHSSFLYNFLKKFTTKTLIHHNIL